MQRLIILLSMVLFPLGSFADQGICRLYPAPSVEQLNILNNDQNDALSMWMTKEVKYTEERSNNFQFIRDDKFYFSAPYALKIDAKTGKYSGYWSTNVQLAGAKTYLVTVWAYCKNANILIWMSGLYSGKKKYNKRIYYLSSTASYLVPLYIDELYASVAGGDGSWRVLYRTIKTPDEVENINIRFSVGSYFGEGELWFDNISITDITGLKELPIIAEVSFPDKKISSISVHLQANSDLVFSDKFNPAIASYKKVIPNSTFHKKYFMKVKFSDGSVRNVFSPLKDQKLAR